MLFIVQWVVYAVSSALRTFPLSPTWKTSINILRLLAISPVLDSISDSPSVLVTMVHSQISLQNGGINLPRTTEFCIRNCLLQKKQQTILILDSSIRFFGIQDCWVQEYECLGQLGQLGRALPAPEVLMELAKASVQIYWIQPALPPSPLASVGPENTSQ